MSRNASKKIDMTKGPIMRLVILFAIPIIIGNVLQQLYNTIDTLIIGNFCDAVSLAAVGTSAQPVEVLLCVFMGIGSGISILVSQYAGSGDEEKLRKIVETSTAFLYLSAIPLTILGMFIGPLVLKIMQVPEDAWDLSNAYLRIIFLGTLGNMGYNLNAGILRGVGDSRASLIFLLISCVINIVLDYLFVAIIPWGVEGAAIATVVAMYASWVFSIVYMRKMYPELEFKWIPKELDKQMLGSIISVGLPLGLNNSLYTVGHIVMQSLINMQGSTFMAACAVATKLTGIANVAITSFSNAACTFSGQNLGAKDYVRLKKGHLLIPVWSGTVTCTAGVLLTIFCRPVLSIFTKDLAVLEMAALYIRIVLPFTWLYAVFNGIINYVNGVGEVRYTTVVNILMLWAVRIPVAYFINYFIDGKYVMASLPISFAFGMICMLCYYNTKKWKKLILPATLAKAE